MSKNKGLLISVILNAAVCYSVIYENQVILNSYTALGVIIFIVMLAVSISVNIKKVRDSPDGKKLIKELSEKKELSKTMKSIDRFCDIILLFFLFGYGYWFLGSLWFCIHFIFTTSINEVVKNHKVKDD